MSIQDVILDAAGEHRKMLFPVIPKAAGSGPGRALFVYDKLWEFLQSTEGDEAWERRVGELLADLELFASGAEIHPKYLFLLYPASKAVWEIRSVGSDPSIRILGLFAARDVFIATNFALREDLEGWQSRGWKDAKRLALARWRHVFHQYQPRKGSNIHQHVSGAIDGKYFKTPGP